MRAHPAGVRSLDHHDVAALHRRHDDSSATSLARSRQAARNRPGKASNRCLHQGTGARTRDRCGWRRHRRRVRRASRRLVAKFQHVAEDRDAASIAGTGWRAGKGERRAHRRRIGVVALVDQRRRTISGGIGERSPRPGCAENNASAASGKLQVDAERLRGTGARASEFFAIWRPGAPRR